MKILETPDYFGHTIFCDDVRQELGGKASFIGVYRAVMFVHDQFPIVIPKFVCGINFFQRATAIKEPARLKIFLPGDEENYERPAQIEGELTGLIKGAEESKAALSAFPKADLSFMRVEMPLVFTPLILREPGLIKVRVVLDDELVVRIGQLQVFSQPADGTPSTIPAY